MRAGGMGITRFRSTILAAAHTGAGPAMVLFYSNRRPEDAAFLPELQELAGRYPKFSLIATMTDKDESRTAWNGESPLSSIARSAPESGVPACF